MTSPSVVTRFAPSPTGNLHVGGARTALYSWAYARGRGGKFLLRLEDTDAKRSSDAAAEGIIRDLRWVGLDWDNTEIPRQSRRLQRYNEVTASLLGSGVAYEKEGAVWFRMGKTVEFDDAVYGHIVTPGSDLPDFVIRKADGFPTFHLAVVVDDMDMSVTHVIRGQEHLSNTPRHAALFDTLGMKRPVWAHTPSIMNPDGSKMSKRDKAKAARAAAKSKNLASVGFDDERFAKFLDKENDDLDLALAAAEKLQLALPEIEVSDFRKSGYLPAALCNYLALLGWNPGENVERFDTKFLCEKFDLNRINKANSKFDREKLRAFNGEAITALPPEVFAEQLRQFMPESHVQMLGEHFRGFAAAYQPRCKTLADAEQMGAFFFTDEITCDAKAIDKVLRKNNDSGFAALRELRETLSWHPDWTAASLHALLEAFAQRTNRGMGDVAQPLRVALTGGTVSPAIQDTLAILGKRTVLTRIDVCLTRQVF